MGLLTDPTGPETFQVIVLKYHNMLCYLTFIIGLAWFALLAHPHFNAGTYFSENALLPGLVDGEFYGDSDTKQFYNNLQYEAANKPGIPYLWIQRRFQEMGLETYTHNFTLKSPLNPSLVYEGKNLYAILRAPRTASTEAMVISVPYRSPASALPQTLPGVSLMLSIAKFFRKNTYLAKDIVFLITEHEQLGMHTWLQAYHQVSSAYGGLDSGDLEGRSGSIQAAINLELHSDRLTHIDIKMEGLNGQLPNLDLINLVNRMCAKEGIHTTMKNRDAPYSPTSWEGWYYSLGTLTSMVATQATGVPSGNHGLFLKYNIEAVTIEGHTYHGRFPLRTGFLQVGRVLEGIVRSLNNLLERFHQSFFFYLLSSNTRYVSIGLYMPPFGLIAAAIVLKAIALRIQTVQADTKQNSDGQKENKDSEIDYAIGSTPLFSIVLIVHLIGLAIANSPPYICNIGRKYGLENEDSILITFGCFFAVSLILPWITKWFGSLRRLSWETAKCAALLELGTLLGSVAVINFSLGLIVAAFYVPACVTVTAKNSWLRWLTQSFKLILISPLVLLFLSVYINTWIDFHDVPHEAILLKSFMAFKRTLVYSIVDGYIYENWAFSVGAIFLYPIWLMFWYISQL